MAEYIELDRVLKTLDDFQNLGEPSEEKPLLFAAMAIRLSNITAADVRPERHGRWVSWEEAGNFIPSPDRYECSVCHDAAQRLCNGFDLLSDYCPNCGAKMDGVKTQSGEDTKKHRAES